MVLAACDAPPQEPAAAGAQASHAEMLSPVDSTLVASYAATALVSVPQDEEAHAAAIVRLMKHPRTDALYAEQVKMLTDSYQKKYPESLKMRQQAILCFIQAILAQPERFSGRDFDRAYEYCDYPLVADEAGHLSLLKIELSFADYRCTSDMKQKLLADLQTRVRQSPDDTPADHLAHAFYIVMQHVDAAQRQEYLALYFQHADCVGGPYRLHILLLADMPARELLPYIVEEAEQGTDAASLLPFLPILMTDSGASDLLSKHPVLGALALAVELDHMLAATDTPREKLDALASSLSASAPALQNAYVNRVLAHYRVVVGQPEVAVDIYRRLSEQEDAMTPKAELLYAAALCALPDGAAEAEALYRSLSRSSEPLIASQALQGLLTLLETQSRYSDALETTGEMLRVERDSATRITILFKRAELAELTGNINEAISLYSLLELEYGGDMKVALPACHKLLQLLKARNFKAVIDKEKATYTPSDWWYAWVRGRDFIKRVRQNPEIEAQFSDSQKRIFEDICNLVSALGRERPVVDEERERATQSR